MRRVLILLVVIGALIGWVGRWWVISGESQQWMSSEVLLTQQQFARCGLPLQLQVEEVERAGFPWSPKVVLRGVELSLIQGNGQSLAFRADKIQVTRVDAELTLGAGPLKALGGNVRGATENEQAPAWRISAPMQFTVEESGSGATYEVNLSGGGIAALVLADAAPGVTAEARPVRVRFPAELILQVKRTPQADEVEPSTGVKRYQFPSIASGWMTHLICDTARAQELFGILYSISQQAAVTKEKVQ
jgi:hypothetical protein